MTPSKQELRVDLARRLAAHPREAAAAASARIAERVLTVPEVVAARGVLACLSFGTEPDTWGLIDQLLELGKALYVPRSDRRDRSLHVHPFPCQLETLSFGLRQPPRDAPQLDDAAIDSVVDVALIPGLGFDRRGYRLGHGAGYFDRFLASCEVTPIGLAFELQIVDQLPIEEHDLPMAAVVTEARICRFRTSRPNLG